MENFVFVCNYVDNRFCFIMNYSWLAKNWTDTFPWFVFAFLTNWSKRCWERQLRMILIIYISTFLHFENLICFRGSFGLNDSIPCRLSQVSIIKNGRIIHLVHQWQQYPWYTHHGYHGYSIQVIYYFHNNNNVWSNFKYITFI